MDKARKKQLKKEYKIKMSQNNKENNISLETVENGKKFLKMVYIMDIFGFGILAIILISAFISNSNIQTMKSSNNSKGIFTNAYGTATTICNHSGCTNYIASSGDTNCCVKHSNKCLNCGKYIDEDAMYCMDCLSSSIKKSSNTYNSKSVSSNGCQYKYSNGSICGKKTNKYNNLCDEHFKQLNDTYNSLVGH